MSNAIQLVQVPFRGDVIEAIRTTDDKIMVSVNRVCESLGIADQRQHAKLTSPDYDWATLTMMVTVARDGKSRDTLMIDAESLPMWLSSILPSKVKVDACEKLRR
jgi:hypothetical protein